MQFYYSGCNILHINPSLSSITSYLKNNENQRLPYLTIITSNFGQSLPIIDSTIQYREYFTVSVGMFSPAKKCGLSEGNILVSGT